MHLRTYDFLQFFYLMFVASLLVKSNIICCGLSTRRDIFFLYFGFRAVSIKLEFIKFGHAVSKSDLTFLDLYFIKRFLNLSLTGEIGKQFYNAIAFHVIF